MLARVTAAMWIQHADQYPIAQMTGGTIILTLGVFDDLWRSHIQPLLRENSVIRQKGERIIDEIKNRDRRTAANQLIAHYVPKKSLLLSETDIVDLIKKNDWKTEQEFLMWIGPVIWNLIDVRDEIRRLYRVLESMDDVWMKNALDIVVPEPDTARGGKHE